MRPFILLSLLLPLIGNAQHAEREMLHFGLKAAIETAEPGEQIPVYLRGDVPGIVSFVRNHGGKVRGTFNDFVATSLPVSAFRKIVDEPAITYVEFDPWKPEALSDVVLLTNNALPVHQGLGPLPQSYFGSDVIIGFIDTGIELDHPDFQHEDGSTRVLYIWDQTQAENDPQRVPQPYDYGQEWTAEDINAGITNHGDQAAWFGHGSTVSGVAVGNANATGDFLGVAPEADIIVVSSNFSRPNWTMTVAEAVQYIFERADAIGKPAVVNTSLGTYLGSHDGLDAASLHIESLLDGSTGKAVVSAAGNSNNWAPYHLGYDIPETDTAFTWFSFNPNTLGGQGAVFVEAWADVEGFENSSFTIGADLATTVFQFRGYAAWRNAATNLNQLMVDTIFWNGAILGIVQSFVGQRGDQYQIQMLLTQPFSSQYRWRFSTTGGGRVDVWSRASFGISDILSTGLPSTQQFPDMVNYRMPDKLMTTVSSWTCSDKVITVANYNNQEEFLNYAGTMTTYDVTAGELSINSSSGPTRDMRQKPEIAATGDIVLSSGRLANITAMINQNPPAGSLAFSGMHYVNGGTSMASPIVAAACALFFERCPNATYLDFREALIENALADEFTGALPHNRWGHGKLDVFATMTSSVSPFGVSLPSMEPCEGESGLLTAEGGLSNYLWNTGDTGPTLAAIEPGIYSAQANDNIGCLQVSNAVYLDFLESPDMPILILEEETLSTATNADAWQWYLNDEAVADATEPSLMLSELGVYTLEATGDNGCSIFSEPYFYGVANTEGQNEYALLAYPNPALNSFTLRANVELSELRIVDLSGKIVLQQNLSLQAGERSEINVQLLSAGIYIVSMRHGNEMHYLKLAIE